MPHTPDGSQRAKAVFMEAIEQEAGEQRDRFLNEACDGHPELRQEVNELLASLEEAGSFLDNKPGVALDATMDSGRPAAEIEATTAPSSLASAGKVIGGRYKLLESIGEGGMGSVWVAEQSRPVKRKVAIKLIKAGMDTREVLARFEAERQALALMDHPNIARVLDGGMTDEGRPYFAMEFVKGVPLTEYCDQARLSVRQRLELFLPICNAVQHAHQKGVIHRDLKPANILICLYDGKPVPKVIDFGLAKAVHQSLTDQTLHTAAGIMLGTPLYMSPEQAETNNLDVDTRTDVYSLGVILYELLTGTTPLEKVQFKQAALAEVMRLIREVEPPRPSTRLSGSTSLPSVAAQRSIDPHHLARSISGDLDWVVMKALEKERSRRYETANGLAADIQRHLADEPVSASPPSVRYRFQKFVKRNRAGVIAASVLGIALLLGVVGTTGGMLWAMKERRGAETARAAESVARQAAEQNAESARQAAKRAEAGEQLAGERLVEVEAAKKQVEAEKQIAVAVKDFLKNKLLSQADVRVQADALQLAGGLTTEVKNDPTIRELLDRAAEELSELKIEANFPNQPLLQAEILQTVGDTYLGVGEHEPAIGFLQRALAFRKQQLAPGHPDRLYSMNSLAMTYLAAGKLELALPLAKETLALRTQHLGPGHRDTLDSMSALALTYWFARKLDQALPLAEETLALRKQHLGPEHRDTLDSMNSLGLVYQEAGKLTKALPLMEETLKLMTAKLGRRNPATLASMHNLALGYAKAGNFDLAVPLFEEAFKLATEKFGPEHPKTLTSMGSLAVAYKNAGQLDLALPLQKKAVQLQTAKLGPKHPNTLHAMNNLAVTYSAAGELDLALALSKEVFELHKATLGPEHQETLRSMHNLATMYWSADKQDLALPLMEETLKLATARLGPEHPTRLASVRNLASAYESVGQLDLALPLMEETLKLVTARLGPEHGDTLASLSNLARVYEAAGKPDMALPHQAEILRVLKATLGPEHHDTLRSMHILGRGYLSAGKLDLALPLMEETLRLVTVNLGPEHPGTVASTFNLVNGYDTAGKPDLSVPLLEKLLKLFQAKVGPEHPDTLKVMKRLASSYQAAGQRDKPLPLLEKVLKHYKLKPGPEAADTLSTMALIGVVLVEKKAFTEAELILRECLTLRTKTQPEAWSTFNTQSLLGGAMLGQKEYAAAEPLLLKGYEGLKKRRQTIPAHAKMRVVEAAERLVKLYEATDRKVEAAKWLEELKAATQPETPATKR